MKRRMNGYLLAGLIVTGLMAALILVGLVWTPYDPDALLAGPKLEGPSLASSAPFFGVFRHTLFTPF